MSSLLLPATRVVAGLYPSSGPAISALSCATLRMHPPRSARAKFGQKYWPMHVHVDAHPYPHPRERGHALTSSRSFRFFFFIVPLFSISTNVFFSTLVTHSLIAQSLTQLLLLQLAQSLTHLHTHTATSTLLARTKTLLEVRGETAHFSRWI